jgi:Ligand-binding domain of nuclear hormone receptor
VACRSLQFDDYLLLGNHYVIQRNTSDPALSRVAGRILDEIVKPLKDNQLDEKEYACLKAIVFFDNGLINLELDSSLFLFLISR